MHVFKENNCRLCKKVFCCVNCRKKHEASVHRANPDCDICFYGKIVLKNLSDDLLEHIKIKHWPLHCTICKRMFESVDELIAPNLCSMSKKSVPDASSKTPVRSHIVIETTNDSNFESPPVMYPFGDNVNKNIIISVTNNIISLTTSTPMQGEQTGCFLDNLSQAITPVEPFKDRETTSLLGSLDKPKKSTINRRVTFNETQLTETLGSSDHKKDSIRGSLNKATRDEDQRKEDIGKCKMQISQETLWETAISDSACSLKSEINVLANISNGKNSSTMKEEICQNQAQIVNFGLKHQTNEAHVYSSIWSSMTNIVKNMLSGFSSLNSQSNELDENISIAVSTKRRLSNKRLRSDSDICHDLETFKKMKFTDIKCRKPINCISPYKFIGNRTTEVCNKSTQTDD